MQRTAICDVDQRNDLIGMIKVGKETHVFLFFTSAYKGQKLMRTMLGAEEASYHLPPLVCRTVSTKRAQDEKHAHPKPIHSIFKSGKRFATWIIMKAGGLG